MATTHLFVVLKPKHTKNGDYLPLRCPETQTQKNGATHLLVILKLKHKKTATTHLFVVLKNLRSVTLLCETHYHRRFIQDPQGGDSLMDPE
jgi:hypothetical protein